MSPALAPTPAHGPRGDQSTMLAAVQRVADLLLRWLGPEAEPEAPSISTAEDTGERRALQRQRSVA